jgi:phage terminase small subunit
VTKAVARKDDALPDGYGPAMAALANDRMRVFVMQFILTGCGAQAARKAGYGTPETTAEGFAKLAWQLTQRPTVQAAIMEETRRWFRIAAPAAVKVYHDVLMDGKAKDADRLRAADAVMARVDPIIAGQVIKVEHEHHHRHSLSADEITRRIVALASKVGVDVASFPPVIDAVAEPIEETLQ